MDRTRQTFTLSVLPGALAICRLDPASEIPAWALKSGFFAIARTADELSVVCRQQDLPAGVTSQRDWAGLKVEGPLDFSQTGVLAALAAPLARARISIFVISTYDTDYLLVKRADLENATAALAAQGHRIRR